MELKIVIAGSRNFRDYELLKENCINIIGDCRQVQIVSGTAKGADELGERFANEMGYSIKKFPADWDKYGKSAGYKRNEEMAKYADMAICFWDNKSKGTKHMIDLAKKHNKVLKVVIFN